MPDDLVGPLGYNTGLLLIRMTCRQLAQMASPLTTQLTMGGFEIQCMVRHKMKHERYSRLMAKMQRAAPPSIASLDDESTNGWLDEADVPESDSSATLSIMPDVTREAPAMNNM